MVGGVGGSGRGGGGGCGREEAEVAMESMAWQMVARMREYSSGSKRGSGRFVARRVADELKVADVVAADAIRDVETGREYSFLVNAYKPRYFYWEGYDMIRKLMLVGSEFRVRVLWCCSIVSLLRLY